MRYLKKRSFLATIVYISLIVLCVNPSANEMEVGAGEKIEKKSESDSMQQLAEKLAETPS